MPFKLSASDKLTEFHGDILFGNMNSLLLLRNLCHKFDAIIFSQAAYNFPHRISSKLSTSTRSVKEREQTTGIL